MDRLEPAVTRMILVKTVALKIKQEMEGAGNMDISQDKVKQERTKRMRGKYREGHYSSLYTCMKC